MKTSREAAAFLISLIVLLSPAGVSAASLSLVVNRSSPAVADPLYPGTGSMVTSETDKQTGLTFAIAGRNYGVNPAPGQARWGLGSGPGSNSTFVVTNGFAPAAAGSKTTSSGQTASYISITVGNVLPNTLFQNVSIDFNGLNSIRTSTPWAATSTGGFNNWVAATQSNGNGNGNLSVTLPNFTWPGDEPLEIRIYGITGADEGRIAAIKINGSIVLAPLVPEPSIVLLALIPATAWLSRHRRK